MAAERLTGSVGLNIGFETAGYRDDVERGMMSANLPDGFDTVLT
jgi:hypothetical protein